MQMRERKKRLTDQFQDMPSMPYLLVDSTSVRVPSISHLLYH